MCYGKARYLGAIFDLSISIQNRETGTMKRHLDLRNIAKIAVRNRTSDLDVQHWHLFFLLSYMQDF